MNTEDEDRIDLSALRRARAPERDLWPQIESRLAPRRRGRWGLGQFALAASLVAGLAAAFAFALPQIPHDGGVTVAAAPLADDPSRAIVKANLGLVRQAERELHAALEQDPESASLRQLLARTQSRQRELSALL